MRWAPELRLPPRLAILLQAAALVAGAAACGGCLPGGGRDAGMDAQARDFIERHVKTIEPLQRELALTQWNASISGRREDYDRFAALEIDLRRIYSDPARFAAVRRLRDSGSLSDPLLRRQVDLLYRSYLENQIPADLTEAMVRKGTEAENLFNTFRARLGGREVSDNEIRDILRRERRSDLRREAWEASKQIGVRVAPIVLEVVRLRNEAARRLGFPDYYAMSIELQEQDLKELLALFDELVAVTEEPFRRAKAEIDAVLAARYGVPASELMPWHYADPFFQEAPFVVDFDFDAPYKGRDVVSLADEFYRRMGLPANDVLERSDLREKKGKEQHAYCIDIDRRGDVRVLANVRDNDQWMETMLHELGHAVYDKNVDPELPFLLRQAAHTFTTEAVAMFFGRRSRSEDFARRLLGLGAQEAARYGEAGRRMLRYDRLVFSRWVPVMLHFERGLYGNPDQDLNRLWWDLVERHQLLRRPGGEARADWASKIHVVTHPVYYHNYMLGEMLASQLQHRLARHLGASGEDGYWLSFVDAPEAGAFLREKVFDLGARLHWRDVVAESTGEPLSAKYFAAQFVSPPG